MWGIVFLEWLIQSIFLLCLVWISQLNGNFIANIIMKKVLFAQESPISRAKYIKRHLKNTIEIHTLT